jgi:hypothetical protein
VTVLHDQGNVIANCRTTGVAVDDTEKVGNNQTVSVGNNQTTQVVNDITTIAGENIVLAAGTSITLKCGPATIHMNQAGVISISGMLVFVAGAINTDITAPLTTDYGSCARDCRRNQLQHRGDLFGHGRSNDHRGFHAGLD